MPIRELINELNGESVTIRLSGIEWTGRGLCQYDRSTSMLKKEWKWAQFGA